MGKTQARCPPQTTYPFKYHNLSRACISLSRERCDLGVVAQMLPYCCSWQMIHICADLRFRKSRQSTWDLGYHVATMTPNNYEPLAGTVNSAALELVAHWYHDSPLIRQVEEQEEEALDFDVDEFDNAEELQESGPCDCPGWTWKKPEGWVFRNEEKGHYTHAAGSRTGGPNSRGACIVCGSRSSMKCAKCDMWLCCKSGEPRQSCYRRLHQLLEFEFYG